MTDSDKIHRWLTQEDLDRLLDDAFRRGVFEMQNAMANKLMQLGSSEARRFADIIRLMRGPADD